MCTYLNRICVSEEAETDTSQGAKEGSWMLCNNDRFTFPVPNFTLASLSSRSRQYLAASSAMPTSGDVIR